VRDHSISGRKLINRVETDRVFHSAGAPSRVDSIRRYKRWDRLRKPAGGRDITLRLTMLRATSRRGGFDTAYGARP